MFRLLPFLLLTVALAGCVSAPPADEAELVESSEALITYFQERGVILELGGFDSSLRGPLSAGATYSASNLTPVTRFTVFEFDSPEAAQEAKADFAPRSYSSGAVYIQGPLVVFYRGVSPLVRSLLSSALGSPERI